MKPIWIAPISVRWNAASIRRAWTWWKSLPRFWTLSLRFFWSGQAACVVNAEAREPNEPQIAEEGGRAGARRAFARRTRRFVPLRPVSALAGFNPCRKWTRTDNQPVRRRRWRTDTAFVGIPSSHGWAASGRNSGRSLLRATPRAGSPHPSALRLCRVGDPPPHARGTPAGRTLF